MGFLDRLFGRTPAPATPPTINQRPLTGPAANQPAQPQSVAPTPVAPAADAYVAAPPAANQPLPKDPQQQAIFGVYALQLGLQTPVDVSGALTVLENLGPAFRQDAINAVKNNLGPGQPPMKTLVLIDALSRWGDKSSAAQMAQLMNDPDPSVRQAASQAYVQMANVPTGAAVAPAHVPGQTPAAPAGSQLPQGVVQAYVDRLKSWDDYTTAAYEVAKLPTAQFVQVFNALLQTTPERGMVWELMGKALKSRLGEPGTVEVARALLNKPTDTEYLGRAQAIAALGTLKYGTPADQAGYLKLIISKGALELSARSVLIKHLMTRPDVLNTTAATVALTAILNDNWSGVPREEALTALCASTTTLARDSLGESKLWTMYLHRQDYQLEALAAFEKWGGPFSAGTVETLRSWVNDEKPVGERATALLKKYKQ